MPPTEVGGGLKSGRQTTGIYYCSFSQFGLKGRIERKKKSISTVLLGWRFETPPTPVGGISLPQLALLIAPIGYDSCARFPKLNAVYPLDPCYCFINSNTAAVIALMPVRNVGSGRGWNKLECSEGSGLPDCRLAATFAGSTAPSQNITLGIL